MTPPATTPPDPSAARTDAAPSPPPRLPYVSPAARVLEREALVAEVAALREGGARIVLACGAFESLDAEAVLRLQAARRLGDVLVVAVSPEGERPAEDRMYVVAALECVSAVALDDAASDRFDAAPLVDAIRPDRIA